MSRDIQTWYALSRSDLPFEEYGECQNAKRCKGYHVVLGDGLCADCWDKGNTPSDVRKKEYHRRQRRK